MSLLEKEKRLACMLPNYMQAWGLGRTYTDGTDAFHLMLDKKRWVLDIDELKKAVTKNTSVILVTNPNNPTGAVLSEDEMNAVVEVARKARAWLVVDEIYRGAELEGPTSPTFWGRYDKVVITSGLSKAFAMPGLRLGWVVAPQKLILQLWIHHDYLTLTPNVLSDHLAAIAMQPVRRESILERTRQILKTNLPPIESWFNERQDLFQYTRPQAGAIIYFLYKQAIKPQVLIDRMRVEKSVLLVPANHFGMNHRGIRTGFGYDLNKTLKGLSRLEELLRNINL
jgi:aspartate/methionine/tyrosine aminotransferase